MTYKALLIDMKNHIELREAASPELISVWLDILNERFDAPPTIYTEKAFRGYAWINHGCSISALYGDDGEMQCGNCRIDFLRDPVSEIFRKLARGKND